MNIRALLLDLDGVIRHFPGSSSAEVGTGLPSGAVRKAAFVPERLLPALTGRVSDVAWRASVREALRTAYPDARVDDAVRRWSDVSGQVIDREVLTLLAAARRSTRLVLVTNATTRLSQDLAALALTDAFDAVVNSSEVGAAKPDPLILERALALAEVDGERALFIDDSPQNVESARRLGMRAERSTDVDALRSLLEDAGLLV